MASGNVSPTATPAALPAPTESSPLLVGQRQRDPDEAGRDVADGEANGETGGAPRDGNPEMAKKMHLFIPAVGIGVSLLHLHLHVQAAADRHQLYLVAIDQLLTVATYAKIGSELNALNNISWIATSRAHSALRYFLTLTSFQPLYGKLSDIFGRKECLLFAYAVFALGCVGCGLAQDMIQLCVSRAVAGIGGGGMNAVVSILLSDIVPLRERGVWQGYINIIFAAGTSTGAPLGGLLADSIGWRSFLAQAPLCCVAWVAVYFVLDVPRPSHSHWLDKMRMIDFLGAFVLVLAVVALLVGLDSGSNLGWSHLVTVVPLALAPVLFALFVLVEVKVATHPFAPGHIIFDRGLFACFLANFFGVAGQFGVLFYLPLYFQAVEAHSATVSGVLLVPGMIAAVMASIGGGWVMKRTGKFYAITVAAYGLQVLSFLPLAASLWYRATVGEVVALIMNAFGGGSGMLPLIIRRRQRSTSKTDTRTAITTTLIGLLANAATKDTAVVVACSYLFRSLGSSIGISISSAVLQQMLRAQLAARLPNGDDARRIEERVRQNIDYIKELPPGLAAQVRDSYQMATIGAFAPALVFSVVAFVVAFWVREKSLKR
ncbi:Vacuolar membrane amino acid uptake transporter fnx2 [Tolypocladium ophioglossoides CBS 100239]|uniref:Vacuolar membrane amino acid uptake transporter fnx2 n=1 Tax=Tolypocladium ophioglossoides (strain CBS 100239) TaxID=1163406 RepID=A0A0L0NM52_TOLOC|nr:Vacuolar membrane amino acid uptake transporter fnx2 [Tolypocladium ophioglossoides CBS 100239]